MHKAGTYTDHNGAQPAHNTLATMSIHHHTDTCCGGTCCDNGQDPASTQIGWDILIYKLTKDGAPVSVYGVDTMPVDGITNGITNDPSKGITGGSVNGGSGGYSAFPGIASFETSGNAAHMAIAGRHRGRLSFRKADGTLQHFDNAKLGMRSNGWGYNAVVAKIDMENSALAWVTSEGMMLEDEKTECRAVGTTAAGHVIAIGEKQGDAAGNFIIKFNGADGAVVWSKTYSELDDLYALESVGEMAYVTGEFKSNGTEAFATATNGLGNLISSCDSGERQWNGGDSGEGGSASSVFAIDASGADGPAFTWVTQIGCGTGYSVKVEGDYLYISGYLEKNTTVITTPAPTGGQGACALTGKYGGYLAKISKADGKCVWAKDLGAAKRVVANAVSVWTMYSDDDPYKFDAEHIVKPADRDVIMGRFDASNGVGLWGSLVGGPARDYAYDMDMTPTGPVTVGYSKSDSLTVGAVTATNLQNQAASAVKAGDVGHYAMFAMQLSTTDVAPACLTCGAGGDLLSATVNANKCYADGQCIDRDSFSTSNPCFRCDPDTADKSLTKVLDNHCFLDGKCIAKDFPRPAFKSYNTNR